jgi:uncharacterized protein (TIGR03067 family)
MRRYALVALMAGSLVAADDRKEEAIQKDYERLAGTWRLASAVEDGKPVPEEQIKNTRLITKGDTFVIEGDTSLGTSPAGTFKIDPTKRPKAVDSLQGKGPQKGETVLGIYEILDANTKRACWAPPGQPRPTAFESKPGSGHLLQVWKRVSP